jgi:hypothetical protein
MTGCERPAKWHPGAIGRPGQPRPGGAGAAGLPLRRGKGNGPCPGQRPGGRRYCLPVSWGFRRLGPCCRAWIRRGIGNASASAQVTGSGPCRVKIVKEFEFVLLTSAPGRIRPALAAPERVAVQAPDLRKHARRCPVRARTRHSRVRSAGSAAEQCGLWRRRATWPRPEDHPLQDSGRSYRLRLCCAGKRGLAIRRQRGRDVGLVCGGRRSLTGAAARGV